METFQCAPFGTITLRRRHGARNIRIRIEADSLLVSADYYTSIKDIILLLEENREAILTKQQALKSNKKFINEDFKISNRYFSISVQRDNAIRKYLFVVKAENNSVPYKFVIRCNNSIDFNDNEIQDKLLNAINKVMRNVANNPLTSRTMQIAQELGFDVNAVKIKIEKTKWGSCSSRKNINLSAYLILLPPHLMDFVIIHELCHLKEMNHSKQFHELVNSYTEGRESELEKQLKKYSINIFDYTEQADV